MSFRAVGALFLSEFLILLFDVAIGAIAVATKVTFKMNAQILANTNPIREARAVVALVSASANGVSFTLTILYVETAQQQVAG